VPALGRLVDSQQPEGRRGLGLALERERLDRLCVDGLAHEPEQRRVERIAIPVQRGVAPIRGKRVLEQVVGAEAPECELVQVGVTGQHRRWDLEHDAEGDRAVGNAVAIQRRACLALELMQPRHVRGVGDHRGHDLDGARDGGPEAGPELRDEQVRTPLGEAEGTDAKEGVVLARLVEVLDLLVSADVEQADGDR
jgi:hypothetical protein